MRELGTSRHTGASLITTNPPSHSSPSRKDAGGEKRYDALGNRVLEECYEARRRDPVTPEQLNTRQDLFVKLKVTRRRLAWKNGRLGFATLGKFGGRRLSSTNVLAPKGQSQTSPGQSCAAKPLCAALGPLPPKRFVRPKGAKQELPSH